MVGNYMTTAFQIQSASLACTAMKEVVVSSTRSQVRDVHQMKPVEDRVCAYLRLLYQLMEHAKKHFSNQMEH